MAPYIYIITTALALSRLTSAHCQLSNKLTKSNPPPEPKAELCRPQGEGQWTFSMDVHEVDVPTFDSGAVWAGLVQGNSFMIYDNACVLKGVYEPGAEGNDCGIPFTIEENFLPFVLTVKQVNFDVGAPRFQFAYANGLFTIGNNHCTCKDVSHNLEAESACKCAFPLHGEPA
ncbi:hypothetical protein F5Y13DRAFT_193542 [Hypoxylon sp. FL1857]|nr:hypothetical protein F5Y13DRAFT_193542 [Hypoxylon sp. FL1857]